jgi:hypothetical protein
LSAVTFIDSSGLANLAPECRLGVGDLGATFASDSGANRASLVEVNDDESVTETVRDYLNKNVGPRAAERGAKAGYWLAPAGGRGVSLVVFDTEHAAQQAASMLRVGKPPAEGAPEGITVRSVEVHEVIASV